MIAWASWLGDKLLRNVPSELANLRTKVHRIAISAVNEFVIITGETSGRSSQAMAFGDGHWLTRVNYSANLSEPFDYLVSLSLSISAGRG